MTTSGKKSSQYLGACVAALLALGLAGCSGDNVIAEPAPKTVTVPPSPESATPPPSSTAPASPSSTPPFKTAKPTPPAKSTPTKPPVTKKPTVKPTVVPTRLTLNPMWEDKKTGDPGGTEWLEVGATKHLKKATCNRDFRNSEKLKLNDTKEVNGSLVTVIATAKGTVITTNLKATAFIFNDDVAARVPDVLWDRPTNPPTYTILFPKAIWEKTLGGKIISAVACV